jgi:hypothetical protein
VPGARSWWVAVWVELDGMYKLVWMGGVQTLQAIFCIVRNRLIPNMQESKKFVLNRLDRNFVAVSDLHFLS